MAGCTLLQRCQKTHGGLAAIGTNDITIDQVVSLELSDFLNLVKNTWLQAVLGFLVAAALSVGISFLLEPEYRVRVLLEYVGDPTKHESVGSTGGGLSSIAAIAGINVGLDGNPKDAAMASLDSWDFAKTFIDGNNLASQLNPEKWDTSKNNWHDPENEPNEWQTIKRFRRDILYVSNDAKTGLVSLIVEWKDPNVAADWATKLVSLINERLRETTLQETMRSIDHLKDQLSQTQNAELQRVIAGLLQAQIQSIMFADIRDEFAFRTIDPAFAPPLDEYIFPNHLVFLILGGGAGALVAVFLTVLYRRRRANA